MHQEQKLTQPELCMQATQRRSEVSVRQQHSSVLTLHALAGAGLRREVGTGARALWNPIARVGCGFGPWMLRYLTLTTSPSRLYGNATHSSVCHPDPIRKERDAVRKSFAAMTSSRMPREVRNARPARDSGTVISAHRGACTGCAVAAFHSAPAVTRLPLPLPAVASCAARSAAFPTVACTHSGPSRSAAHVVDRLKCLQL